MCFGHYLKAPFHLHLFKHLLGCMYTMGRRGKIRISRDIHFASRSELLLNTLGKGRASPAVFLF